MYENYQNSINLKIIQWVKFLILSVDNKFDIENCKKTYLTLGSSKLIYSAEAPAPLKGIVGAVVILDHGRKFGIFLVW
jgi:hypothetical protein